MKLGGRPALLILSGQGVAKGVEHFTSPVSFEDEYPPRHLLDTWCSLTDPVIPKTLDEIVLMVARQSTSDGTPWIILSEYVQATLKRSTRGKHYAGVGLAVKECTLPIEAIPLVHSVLEAMLQAKMDGQHFIESIGDWTPPAALLSNIQALAVEPLQPGFDGVQPGIEEARIVHSMNPEGIVRESQERSEYRDFCAAFVIRRKGKPEKDSCYVRSPHDVALWEEALSPPRPMPVQGPSSIPSGAFEFVLPERADEISYRPPTSQGPGSPSLARVGSDLSILEDTVAQLARKVRKLEAGSTEDPNRRPLGILEWAVICAVIALIVLVVWVVVRDSTDNRRAAGPPMEELRSNPEDETRARQPPANSYPERSGTLNAETEEGSALDPTARVDDASDPPAERDDAERPPTEPRSRPPR
ncbi:MAG TPA: hypothetical protein VEX35_05395 [Allosphingosinicella sp.]|nr:hypothetical protein [Allosphingosinicella sp.]